jgi:hypothetical protein
MGANDLFTAEHRAACTRHHECLAELPETCSCTPPTHVRGISRCVDGPNYAPIHPGGSTKGGTPDA